MYSQILTSVKITEELLLEGELERTVDLNSEYGSITVNKEKVKMFNIELYKMFEISQKVSNIISISYYIASEILTHDLHQL